MRLNPFKGRGSRAVVPPLLGALSISVNSFATDALPGAVLATISGRTPGSTLDLLPSNGRVVFSADKTQLLRGLTAWSAGDILIGFHQTHPDYTSRGEETFACTIVAPAPPVVDPATDTQISIRPNEKLFVDLSTQVAPIHNSNDITISVAGPGGYVIARIHLGKSLISGQSSLQVKRELLDHFHVESVGAVAGETAGTIIISGYTGAGNTGRLSVQTLSFMCSAAPPATWEIGAKTPPGYGGLPLHTYFTNPAQWALSPTDQTHTGQLAIRSDGAGVYRLVLAGWNTSTNVALPTANPTVTPTPGETVTAVLRNATTGASHTVAVTFPSNTVHIAPWSTDTPTGTLSTTQSQLQAAACYRTKGFGDTYVLEDGVYSTGGVSVYLSDRGPSFSAAFTNTGAMPSTIFATGDGWTYSPLPVFNPGLFTIRSRTPFGARFGGNFTIRADYVVRAAQKVLGLRLTNLDVAGGIAIFGANYFQFAGYDHCRAIVPVQTASTYALAIGNQNYPDNRGLWLIANDADGNVNIAGMDSKMIGNRFTSHQGTQDLVDFTLGDTDQNTPRSEIGCNFSVNKQGLVDATHEDIYQFRGNSSFFPNAGRNRICRFWGNVHFRRPGYTAPSTGYQYAGGTMLFVHDMPQGMRADIEVCGNFGMDIGQHGMLYNNPGVGKFKWNYLSYDYNVTNPAPLTSNPWLKFQEIGAGNVGSAAGVQVDNNIFSSTQIYYDFDSVKSDTGTVFPLATEGVNNQYGWVAATQLAHFVNPTLAAAEDVGDVLRAFTFLPGQEVPAGPLYDGKVDHRRQTFTSALFD